MFVACAAMRLARFNIQSAGGDKRYFVGMPSPAAGVIPAATVYAFPTGLSDYRAALPALAMVIVPAILMISTIRFRSFKNLDLQMRRPYTVLLLIATGIMLIATHPRFVLIALAYTYLIFNLAEFAWTRVRRRGTAAGPDRAEPRAVDAGLRQGSGTRD
jgi:CDP-diacylglycerol--serine O-phosphatidyltransferase